ncbi:MAG: DUF1501 domain-containing protein [Pseudomonadota bacterium]
MNLSRRSFLRNSALTFGATSLAPMAALAADTSGYKALVCVFLYGGCDSQDILINYDQPSYNQWAEARLPILQRYAGGASEGARARSNLLPLDLVNSRDFGSQRFALPPEMSGIKSLFDAGQAAIVPNVGPLIEPTTRRQVEDDTAILPSRLQSHNDQQSTWQAFSVEGAGQGWGGLILDAVEQSSPYTAISVTGQSVFLSGADTRQLQLSSSGKIERAFGTDRRVYRSDDVTDRLRAYYRQSADHLRNPMMRDLVGAQAKAIDDTETLASLLEQQQLGARVRIDGNRLSNQFATVADMISVRSALGLNRQIFFVGMGGFDTHNDQAFRMPALLGSLSDAIASFQSVMNDAGLGNNVTTFTASDFGRTFTSNASGTDHGWGGHQIVVGGAVRGGRVLGAVPEPTVDHDQAYRNRGSLIPTISIDQYGSELGRWFGLSGSELDAVFPNRNRFDPLALPLF